LNANDTYGGLTMADYDVRYECRGYGDDYRYDDEGELTSACGDCPYNSPNLED
jgi:hypothetical protein